MNVAAVVLAAGASRRLGQRKQDVLLAGETLLERSVRIANLAALHPVFVVLAPDSRTCLPSATILTNSDAAEGMASSIRTGVLAAMHHGSDGIVILACDQPSVTSEHLRAIVGNGARITASAYAGRKGVPAYFPASAFAALQKLRGDTGARSLLSSANAIELPLGDLDIDTPVDLARAREIYCP